MKKASLMGTSSPSSTDFRLARRFVTPTYFELSAETSPTSRS